MEGHEAVLREDLSRFHDQIRRCLSEPFISIESENFSVDKESIMAVSLRDDHLRAAKYIFHAFQKPNLKCNMEMLEDGVLRTVQTLHSLCGLALGETNVWLQVPWSLLPDILILRTFPSFAWLVLGAAMGFLQLDKNVILSHMRFGNHLFRWELHEGNHSLLDSKGLLVQFCRYLRFSAYVYSHDHAEALKRGLEYAQDFFGGHFREYFGGLHAIYVRGHIANQFRAVGDFDKAAETSRVMLKLAAEQQIQGTTLKQCLIEAAEHLPPQEAVDVLERATEWKSRSGLRGEGESFKESLTAMTLMLRTYCLLQRFKEAAQLVQWIDHTADKPKGKLPVEWTAWLIQKRMFYQYTGNTDETVEVCVDLAEEGEGPYLSIATCLAKAERIASEGIDFENAILTLNECGLLGMPELERSTVSHCSSDPQVFDHLCVPLLYTNRGMYRLALEQRDEALADLVKGVRIAKEYYGSDPTQNHPFKLIFPLSYWCQAQCLLQMGEIEEAQSRLDEARSLAPEGSYIQNEVGCTQVHLLLAAEKHEEAAAKGRENFLKFVALQSSLGRGRKAEWESLYDIGLGASAQNMECILASDDYCKGLVWTERRHMRLFMFETTEDINQFDEDDEYARSVIAQAAERCVDSSTAIIVYSLCQDQSHVHTFMVTRVAKDGNLAPTLYCSGRRLEVQSLRNDDPENWCSGIDPIVDTISDALNAITCKEDSKLYLERLYQFFVEIVENVLKLPDGIDTLLFSAHGEFSKVPFAALYDHRDQKFLIQKKCVGVIPGFRALHHCFKNQDLFQQNYATAKLCPPFVAGNPSPMGRPFLKKPLLKAEEEAEEVARLFGVTPCVGSKMTKRDVKAGLENSSLVHIATHGKIGGDDQSQGFLVMQANDSSCDEALTGSEISDLKVRAGLVVLSACRSGDGMVTREGLLGLGRAVLLAGAPTVIVTLWKVDDGATKALVIEMMKEFRKGEKTVNQCLQLAMQQMIEDGMSVYEWAPLVVLGSPTMRWPLHELASDLTNLSIN